MRGIWPEVPKVFLSILSILLKLFDPSTWAEKKIKFKTWDKLARKEKRYISELLNNNDNNNINYLMTLPERDFSVSWWNPFFQLRIPAGREQANQLTIYKAWWNCIWDHWGQIYLATTTILYLCPHGVTLCTSYFIVIIVSEIVRWVSQLLIKIAIANRVNVQLNLFLVFVLNYLSYNFTHFCENVFNFGLVFFVSYYFEIREFPPFWFMAASLRRLEIAANDVMPN